MKRCKDSVRALMLIAVFAAAARAAAPRRAVLPPPSPSMPAVPSVPNISLPILPALAPTPTLLAPTVGVGETPRPSRDVARDEAATQLAEAGLPERLRADGLVLWHVLRYRARSGEKAALTVGLPADGRPFERGGGDPERRAELERRLAAVESRIVSEAARILGLPEDMVSVDARLIETCCGAGCQPCLLTKPEHAERWTGLPPRAVK